MGYIRALWRATAFIVLVLSGVISIILVGWTPIRIQGIRLGPWIVHRITYAFIRVIRVRIHLSHPEKWRSHAGFLFTNHTSYMDILTILGSSPVRFVAKAEVRKMPFIGWFAAQIGCVFVKREEKASRKQARQALVGIDHRPPMVLFPEGKTAPYGTLLPFRKGAFEIAQGSEIPFLPTAIVYSEPRLVDWKSRPAREAFWDVLSRPGTLDVHFHVLEEARPTSESDPIELMNATREQMLDTLVREGGYDPH